MPQPVRLIQSVERSLMILDALSRASEIGYSLGEISKEVGINASTTHHLLCTLGYYQVVEQDPVSKRYRLGIHLVELGNSAMASTSLARLARRYVNQLWEYAGQSCSLLVFHGLMRSQILGTSSQQMLSAKPAPLEVSSLHSTGSGKLLLAFLPEQELQDYLRRTRLERFTASTITKPDDLTRELEEIRIKGYALDCEEYGKGVRCIAVPIKDASLHVVGCLDMVFPGFDVNDEQLLDWVAKACQCAADLSSHLHDIGLVVK